VLPGGSSQNLPQAPEEIMPPARVLSLRTCREERRMPTSGLIAFMLRFSTAA
jgi:hypothetical protein